MHWYDAAHMKDVLAKANIALESAPSGREPKVKRDVYDYWNAKHSRLVAFAWCPYAWCKGSKASPRSCSARLQAASKNGV
ncbi:hypothetical protein SPRG_11677 [Saprolegnia parasitica CBS 223.65]|uniref:Uncharacterized protein n=1 Tax=Saprolegnia parasitica (strain CBS 223.65) TaxID=695850 RepID=A0A067BW28_SAPPC|nr:hypothetical protein SPRG_11677 [Saprolegnia parasitica CBS 223.65]KDO22493.1 hypothetical protein SPRG_11677 [Saprolegnia parasitica CBS 223.65]|eukprot:XP_012206741.1 hypothetical protein SPRG_11677 [Saprolegnia parasitica CBS 223.65]